jgi:8-oxo-dGTP diphosphatase
MKSCSYIRIGSRIVSPSWCGIGGHFEIEELNDPKACVLRELEEEMRLTEDDLYNLRLRYITLRLKNNEIRQNYYFFADLKDGVDVKLECDEGKPNWF